MFTSENKVFSTVNKVFADENNVFCRRYKVFCVLNNVLRWNMATTIMANKYVANEHCFSVKLLKLWRRWIEQFMGTGVAAFSVTANGYLLSDINSYLINFYNVIK
ncbi:MAG: DNA adenine methylase [Treponema sp.]|nr:DNA adenine methylase [Treponema sp.]